MARNPEFIIYAGPMFSGKTSKLLLQLERYKYQRKNVALFKPLIDDRYSIDNVTSHGGITMPARNVKSGADILSTMIKLIESEEQYNVVAVDEAFMITGVADALAEVYKLGLTVVVSTLDLSATVKSFREVEKMFPWATTIEKCTAVCTACGKDARFTYKKPVSDDHGEIQVGGSELYEPRCWFCHPLVNVKLNTGE